MKLKKLVEGIELPEKTSPQRFINVRANRRIDVCSGNMVRVPTGIHVTVARNETARLLGIASGVVDIDVTTGELFIDIYNKYERNLMIYPGMVLAEILVEKAPVKARKPRKTRITSSARLVKDVSK